MKQFFSNIESKIQNFTDINLRPLTDLFYNPEVLRVDDYQSTSYQSNEGMYILSLDNWRSQHIELLSQAKSLQSQQQELSLQIQEFIRCMHKIYPPTKCIKISEELEKTISLIQHVQGSYFQTLERMTEEWTRVIDDRSTQLAHDLRKLKHEYAQESMYQYQMDQIANTSKNVFEQTQQEMCSFVEQFLGISNTDKQTISPNFKENKKNQKSNRETTKQNMEKMNVIKKNSAQKQKSPEAIPQAGLMLTQVDNHIPPEKIQNQITDVYKSPECEIQNKILPNQEMKCDACGTSKIINQEILLAQNPPKILELPQNLEPENNNGNIFDECSVEEIINLNKINQFDKEQSVIREIYFYQGNEPPENNNVFYNGGTTIASCLPPYIEYSNTTFDDNVWHHTIPSDLIEDESFCGSISYGSISFDTRSSLHEPLDCDEALQDIKNIKICNLVQLEEQEGPPAITFTDIDQSFMNVLEEYENEQKDSKPSTEQIENSPSKIDEIYDSEQLQNEDLKTADVFEEQLQSPNIELAINEIQEQTLCQKELDIQPELEIEKYKSAAQIHEQPTQNITFQLMSPSISNFSSCFATHMEPSLIGGISLHINSDGTQNQQKKFPIQSVTRKSYPTQKGENETFKIASKALEQNVIEMSEKANLSSVELG